MNRALSRIIILCLALGLGLLTGCTNVGGGGGLSGVVNMDGSTSMEKVMGALAEAFMDGSGTVTVNFSGTGSSAGITAARDGTAHIGLASRKLKPQEEASGLIGTTVALDGIAIVVNPSNPVSDLTMEQITALATGEITNWKEVGGNDAPVVMIGREAGSGTRDGFESITGTKDKSRYQNELTSTGDVIANVSSNPNAIGYTSLASVNEKIKAVTVGGVAPSEETIANGTYTIQRDFVMVTRGDTALTPAAQAFFDYALSEEAYPILRIAGVVPPAK